MKEYYAMIGDEVRGPFTMEQLRARDSSGEISEITSINEIPNQDWILWRDVRQPIAVPALPPSPRVVREATRKETGYPVLRASLKLLVFLAPALAILCFIKYGMVGQESLDSFGGGFQVASDLRDRTADTWLWMGLYNLIATPFIVLSLFIFQAFLDIVDVHLKKVGRGGI